jgi:hypothetical protein
MSRTAIVVFSGLLAVPALAGSVYLNGVRIDGVTNQKFDKVNVRIDEAGNLFIDAPGYSVRQLEGGSGHTATPPPQPPGVLTRKYFLVTEQTAVGMTEFDIEMYVNSKWVRRIRNADEQIVTEITKSLTPGRNTILFIAKKNVTGERKSFSKEHVFRVIIGEGQMSGDHVMIENPVVKFERTAADAVDGTQEFTFTTR